MIDTDPYDLTPSRTRDDSRSASGPAAALRTLIRRRQALLHQEFADLKSLGSYAERLVDRLPPEPLRRELHRDIEILADPRVVAARLDTLLEDAGTEVLIVDRQTPTQGSRDCEPEPFGVGCGRIRELLARGIAVRILMDRRRADFPDRAKALIGLTGPGLETRVGVGLPTGLVVVDRCRSLLSATSTDGPTGMAHVLGTSLSHRAGLPLFDALWQRATPVGGAGSPLTADQRELLGLLAAGLKDESIARRLGVHVHTARRRISRMLDDLGADTRFQAGVQATIRGWLQSTP
ncbi:hypothetical protein ABZY16_25235 [Streptomyces sp. NPDC006553]|uniref:hypothetical protein n=1 Tax=Streptomyces sp. NPDC006553 TaxID=3157180 RepID=UPI0033AE2309